MYPDLISRSLGFIGVFITLMTFGLVCEHNFQAQVQDTYSTLVVSINHSEQIQTEAKKNTNTNTNSEKNTQEESKNNQITQKSDNEYQVEKQIAKNSVITHKNKTNDIPPKKQVETVKTQKQKEQSKKTAAKQNNENNHKNSKKVNQGSKTDTAQNKKTEPKPVTEDASIHVNKSRQAISNIIFDRIQDKIQYPQRAIRRKIQGVVLVEFNVVNGKISSFTIIKSSGHTILDKSAAKLCKELIGFDTKHQNSNIKIHMPIKYALI